MSLGTVGGGGCGVVFFAIIGLNFVLPSRQDKVFGAWLLWFMIY